LTYIFDACVLLALIKNEKGFDKVKALLAEAKSGQSIIYMNIINLIEVNYYFYRVLGKEKSASILEEIYSFPINFIDTIDNVIFFRDITP